MEVARAQSRRSWSARCRRSLAGARQMLSKKLVSAWRVGVGQGRAGYPPGPLMLLPEVSSPSRPAEKALSSQPYFRRNCDRVSRREAGPGKQREAGTDLVGIVEKLVDNVLDITMVALQRVPNHSLVCEASDHNHHVDILCRDRSAVVGHLGCSAPAMGCAVGSNDVSLSNFLKLSSCHPRNWRRN
jgi:hypothetical protein